MPHRAIASLLLLLSAAFHPPAHAQAAPQRAYRVLLVGNSLTYANNFPALLRAVGASQGVRIDTETYAAPNGELADRVHDGAVDAALAGAPFDVVLLQDRAGKPAACMAIPVEQRKAPCAASRRAYKHFADLALARGAKVLLFATSGPDERWQGRLDRSIRMFADEARGDVFNAVGVLDALHKARPDAVLRPDGTHPSPQGSIMLALALYRDITGATPVARDLSVTAPLLPVNAAVSPEEPLERQRALAGDGKATLIPAALVAPLVAALPDPAALEARSPRRGR